MTDLEQFRAIAPMLSDEDLSEAAAIWTAKLGREGAAPITEICGDVLDNRYGIE